MSRELLIEKVIALFPKNDLEALFLDTTLNEYDQEPIKLIDHIRNESENWEFSNYSANSNIRYASSVQDYLDYISENLKFSDLDNHLGYAYSIQSKHIKWKVFLKGSKPLKKGYLYYVAFKHSLNGWCVWNGQDFFNHSSKKKVTEQVGHFIELNINIPEVKPSDRNRLTFQKFCEDEFSMFDDDGDFELDGFGCYKRVETERLWRVWELINF